MKRFVINYYPYFFESAKTQLKKLDLNLIARPPPRIDPIDKFNLSGVYIIPFLKEGGYRNYYIGMTQRKFKVRCKEHIADIKFNRGETSLSRLNK